MTDEQTFRAQIREACPEIAERAAAFPYKRALASKLRAVRDAHGMTQEEVAAASGLSEPTVAQMESLTGPIPSDEAVISYITACRQS